VRWNPSEEAKIINLWCTPHNGVDQAMLDVDAVKAVHQRHFNQFKYSNLLHFIEAKLETFVVFHRA
jgi:hypothetical protein